MTITIDGTTGIASVDGSAGSPSVRGADANSGIFYGTDIVKISTGGTERLNVLSGGQVSIGNTSTVGVLNVKAETDGQICVRPIGSIQSAVASSGVGLDVLNDASNAVKDFALRGSTMFLRGADGEALRICTNRNVTTCQTSSFSRTNVGFTARYGDSVSITRATGSPMEVNRQNDDGNLITFYQGNSSEGNISVSGSTVSYNGGHLSRWSQIKGLSQTDKSARPTIYQGTVMSNLDDLCVWSHPDELYTEQDKTDGQIPEGKNVGDVKKAAYAEDNQQLNMTKISDVEGDKDVAGVFWAWDDDDDTIVNDFYVAMTGDMVIRVAASTTVARGDLLISAGNGTAKPQADDIVRSSTIAKVISTNSTATYADGSKAYPCVLMAC
jgi:hypothetical protein